MAPNRTIPPILANDLLIQRAESAFKETQILWKQTREALAEVRRLQRRFDRFDADLDSLGQGRLPPDANRPPP
jgi:hypothetical protein